MYGWSDVASPTPGSPQVIGSYTGGCIAGAVALPWVGDGYQAMRLSRNRYYGHPVLIRFLEGLSQQAAARGNRLLVGDLGQPRGGPMSGGHRSHQSGLDADIWFLQQPRNQVLPRSQTERLGAPSMIRATEGTLNYANWSPRYRDTLKQAALSPEVERIFVNAIIKQALCDSETESVVRQRNRPALVEQGTSVVGARRPFSCPADLPLRFRPMPAAKAGSARRRLRRGPRQLGPGYRAGSAQPQTLQETRTTLDGEFTRRLLRGPERFDGVGTVGINPATTLHPASTPPN